MKWVEREKTLRVGITGHQRLAASASWHWVQTQMESLLSRLPGPVHGFTSLALGADQLFAETVLKRGGSFTAIIPFAGYEDRFTDGEEWDAYHRLLAQAAAVEVLKAAVSNREAYLRAGQQVVLRSECLIAVWDGKPAAGLGGTADVVGYARQNGKQVYHINPTSRKVCELSID